MKQVFKYSLQCGPNEIQLPLKSKFLSAKFQRNELFAWFSVDHSELLANNDIYVAMTGEGLADNLPYLDTAMSDDGSFVVHIFGGINV